MASSSRVQLSLQGEPPPVPGRPAGLGGERWRRSSHYPNVQAEESWSQRHPGVSASHHMRLMEESAIIKCR
jgi:hypothetical protein